MPHTSIGRQGYAQLLVASSVSSVEMLDPPGKGDHMVGLPELHDRLQEAKQLPLLNWSYQKLGDWNLLKLPRPLTDNRFRHWQASPKRGDE